MGTELDDNLFRASRIGNVDFHLRRITNASDAVDPGDYVTLRQLESAEIKSAPTPIVSTPNVNPPGPSSSTPFYVVPFSSTPVFYRANGSRQKITLTGDCQFDISGFTDGDILYVAIIQDGSGDHLADPLFGSIFQVPPGFAVSPAPNKGTYLTFIHDGSQMTLIGVLMYYV